MLGLRIQAHERGRGTGNGLAFGLHKHADPEHPSLTRFPDPVSGHLTPREVQVLRFIVEGLTNRQIAQELRVSVKTVEKHRQEIMNKLRIHHTAGLTCYALSNGITFPKAVSAAMARRVRSARGNWSSPIEEAGRNRAITARETEVLKLIAAGFLNKQIAAELHLSIKTVANHRQEVMKRLNIHHIAGLTRYALAKGLTWPRPVADLLPSRDPMAESPKTERRAESEDQEMS